MLEGLCRLGELARDALRARKVEHSEPAAMSVTLIFWLQRIPNRKGLKLDHWQRTIVIQSSYNCHICLVWLHPVAGLARRRKWASKARHFEQKRWFRWGQTWLQTWKVQQMASSGLKMTQLPSLEELAICCSTWHWGGEFGQKWRSTEGQEDSCRHPVDSSCVFISFCLSETFGFAAVVFSASGLGLWMPESWWLRQHRRKPRRAELGKPKLSTIWWLEPGSLWKQRKILPVWELNSDEISR